MSLSDTTPEAERVLAEVYRSLSPGKKWLLAGEAYQTGRMLHAAGVRLREPGATPHRILEDWVHRVLGFPHVPVAKEPAMVESLLGFRAAREFIRILDRLGIPYAIGGSLAGAVHGVERFTRDVDITVQPFPGKEKDLIDALGTEHYVSPQAIEEAHRRYSCFNIINTFTGFKADIFICPPGGFEEAAMSRRLSVSLTDEPGEPINVYTAEDIVLFKLRWYRLGNETSEQQWKDIVGVLKAQKARRDEAHLDYWAEKLGVKDLLERARHESDV